MTGKELGTECVSIVNNTTVIVKKNEEKKEFYFDQVLDSQTNQETFYSSVGKNIVNDFVNGYNVTLITYGHKYSGKTYTTQGDDLGELKGFLPRAM